MENQIFNAFVEKCKLEENLINMANLCITSYMHISNLDLGEEEKKQLDNILKQIESLQNKLDKKIPNNLV